MQKVLPIASAVREGTDCTWWRLLQTLEPANQGEEREPLAQGVRLETSRLPKPCLLSLQPGVCCLPSDREQQRGSADNPLAVDNVG